MISLNIESVVVILKLTSQVLIVVIGVWGLFSEPYEIDPDTQKRRITRAGWVNIILLAVGFILFVLTNKHEHEQELAAKERQAQQIELQRGSLAFLRELLLSQHMMSEIKIKFNFPKKTIKNFIKRIQGFKGETEQENSRAVYLATAFQVGGAVVRFVNKDHGQIDYNLSRPQGIIGGIVESGEPVWKVFVSAFHDMFNQRFEIMNNSGRTLVDLINPEQPIIIQFKKDAIVIILRNPGIRFDEIRKKVTFVCGKNDFLYDDNTDSGNIIAPNSCPELIAIKSRDPRVLWDQEMFSIWQPVKKIEVYDSSTDRTITAGEWHSEHLIEASLVGMEPNDTAKEQ